MLHIETFSPGETEQLGEILAGCLKRGTVLALIGELATGKTTLIKGICRGLHVEQEVESPTYTLVNEYRAEIPIYHMDCYREQRIEEWLELGVYDYFYGDGITLVEWADTIEALLPDSAIRIVLEHNLKKDNCREITIFTDPVNESFLRGKIKDRLN